MSQQTDSASPNQGRTRRMAWIAIVLVAAALALLLLRPAPDHQATTTSAPRPKAPATQEHAPAAGTPAATSGGGASAEPTIAGQPTPAKSQGPDQHRPRELTNLDRRKGIAPAEANPARDAALARLRGAIPGVDVQFDPLTGSASHVMAPGRFLTVPRGEGDAPEAAAAAFLDAHRDLFGHDSAALALTRVTREDFTAHNGMKTTVWQQELDGVPLYQTILKANIARNGELVALGSHFVPNPSEASRLNPAERAALIALPPVGAGKAVSLAAANLGDVVPPEQARALSAPEGAEHRTRFGAPGLSDTVAQLTWLPMGPKEVRLAWDVTLMSLQNNGMFRVVVDARSGEVLVRTSLTNDISDASYRVYADGVNFKPYDSPTPMSPGYSTPQTTQPAAVSRNLITLQALDVTASPNGWINDGGTDTFGNNVDAHLDLSNTNPAYGSGTHATSATRVFDFTMDLAQEPTTYRDAAITNLFYLCNWYHDRMYAFGFTESAGNFQQNNFGKGGLGNDAVLADVQDGGGTNNANFSTPPDGSPGRMQMYVFPTPTPDRDGDFDAEVVMHEATHGLSNRLVGGGVGISQLQTQGMGEGWSDFYALCLLSDPTDDVNGCYAKGAYVTYQLSGETTNYYYGIRRYPYSTDMTKNPLTLKDIDPTQASAHAGIPLSPRYGSSNSSPSEVHGQGEVWCVTLWDMRANLINKLGAAAGNQMAIQLVTDGMKLAPANPTFLQSRDSIIQADLVDNGGANRNEIWTAFAKRGMGASASVPANSTTTGVVEAYDMPDPLSVTPSATFTTNGTIGGPFSPASQTYTLTNGGASNIVWSAATGQTWLSISPTSGTLAPGATTTMSVSLSSVANTLGTGTYSGSVTFANATSGVNIVRQVSLGVTPPRVAYFDLSSDPGWTRQGEWAFGTPTGGGGTSHGGHDPTVGATGANVFGINLAGDYSTTVGGPYYLTTGAINLTGYTGSQLRFKRWLNTDYPTYVYATVQVSNDGTNWTTVFTNVAGTAITDSSWTTVQYDISAVADNRSTVYVRWGHQVGSSGAYAYSGWNIDDVEILGTSSGALALSLGASSVTEGAAPLTATLTANPAPASATVVNLTSSIPGAATVPATVTIPAGQSSVTFPVTVVDDALLNGTRNVVISAAGGVYLGAAASLAVNDNESAALVVGAAASVSEGAGTLQGTLSVATAPAGDVVVTMSSSDTAALQVPGTVTILAGQTSANFTIQVMDDNKINGTHSATLTAHVANWTDGTATISILDNETTLLGLTASASVTEGSAGSGTVSISGILPSPLVVSLASSLPSRLTVPATVTIPAGSTSATFTLTAPDNALTDGSASVTVSATASGFTGASSTVTVLDNDIHHFAVSAIGATQIRNSPFVVTLTAQDVNNATVATYGGSPGLSAAGTGGSDSITPSATTAFTSGVWTGSVSIGNFDSNVVITVNDGAGHTGTSNAFNVATGSLHHFAWNTQPTRAVNAPVSATVTAQDAGNNTVTSFTGPVGITGYSAGASIVISEIDTGASDAVEFINVAAVAQDISGWKITAYDWNSWPSPSVTFTVPSGTTCAPNQVFLLREAGTAPGTFPTFYTGGNIYWNNNSTGNPVALLLQDSAGNVADFFCAFDAVASQITLPVPVPAAQWPGAPVAANTDTTKTYQRQGNADHNSSADWVAASGSLGTQNTGFTTPFSGAMSLATVSPATSGAFTNGVWTGNITVSQPASQLRLRADDGSGHTGDSNAFGVTGVLGLSVPVSATEGSAPVTGTVTVSAPAAGDLTVSLASSDLTAATVPATVTILSGQTSATFPITIIDDALIDGTQVAAITAHIASWTDATANISVLDNETVTLALFMPGSVTEGSTATATVSASGAVAAAVTVSLSSGNTSRLTVPATVTIAAGASSATFTLTAVDNALTDGTATVNVTASAAGYNTGTASTTVLDNDVHHYAIASIGSPQTKGVPFNVAITALDVNGNTLPTYAGTPSLTASGAGGACVISPANASGFVGGVWSGQVTSYTGDTNVALTVSDGSGHSGTSNTFNIVNPTNVLTVVEPITPQTAVPGINPRAQLVVGPDGSLYGTTQNGGASNQGTVFKITTSGVMTPLVSFYGANGMQPLSGVVLASDGNFYGTTSAGGSNNLGTIFKMTPSGVLTTLAHLSSATGTVPKAPLLQANDGNFYGTTSAGGSLSSGTIFKMTPSGVLTVLVNFTGTVSTAYGSNCQAGLIQAADGNLYGVTSAGGSASNGTIFKITTGGSFTTLVHFTGTTGAFLGSSPAAALVQAADGNLYGSTGSGGAGGFGTLFKVTTGGTFTSLVSFTGTTGSFLGSSPQGALVQWATDGNLYGMTTAGGSGSAGTLFKVTTAGALTTLRNLTSTSDGNTPFGALVLAGDGNFYGTANSGGTQSRGTVFSLAPSTATFTRIFTFVNSPPIYKHMLRLADGNLYGGTAYGNGGSNSVFKLTTGGSLSQLATFTTTSNTAPSFVEGSDGNLYGTVPLEGGFGSIYKLTAAGSLTTLASFTGSSGAGPGTTPIPTLTQAGDGNFYGATSSGGAGGSGTVFKITPGGVFTSLAAFTGTTGATPGTQPSSRLVQGADGNLYGTTSNGGASNFGTLFKVTPSGILTTLVSFTGTTGSFPGTNPNTNLILASDGNFYGTTTSGGTGGFGTIYKLAPDGTFTTLLSFTSTSGTNLGSGPTTNLVQGSDGNFYGTTTNGGSGGGFGTVYRVTPAGVLTTLVSFTGTSGAAPGATPHGTLRQGTDGFFYGTTTGGGLYGLGTVFRVNAAGIFQSLYTFGTNNDGGSPNISGASLYSDAYRLIPAPDGYLYGTNASAGFRVHQQPAVQSIAASGITPSGATLGATVVANQDAATAYYQYGLSTSYGSQTATQNLAAGAGAAPVNVTLTGLLPGTIYHYRLVTVTSQGTFTTADQTFATSGAPLVITGSFTGTGQTGFTLDGVVNPLGSATTYYYEYGTDTSYGTQTSPQSASSGIANVPVNATINGLAPGTTYHVRLVAANAIGTTYGDDQALTTFAPGAGTLQPMFQYLNTGTAPQAGLIKGSDGNFYGTTSLGGTFGSGTVFRMSPGGALATLANFYGNTNGTLSGASPQGTLVQGGDGNFYGTTNTGGVNSLGTVFKITPAGQLTILASLSSSTGYSPAAGLTKGVDGNFYGVCQSGGASFFGSVIKVTPAGVVSTVVSFSGTTGSYLGSSPRANLTLGSDGNFYGTTATGGSGGFGTIFKLTPAGVLTTLVQFTGTTGSYPGATPAGALVQGSDGNFYGTTQAGGAGNVGTIFKVTPTATFTSLVSFTGTTGAALGSSPNGALVQMPDGNFYGTTQTGGAGNVGTVFQVTPGGTLTTLVSFTGSTGTAPGSSPTGSLVAGADGSLYGTANSGGLNNSGIVFKISTAGLLTNLVNLTSSPGFGRLVQNTDGKLYGATLGGGGATGYGTLFAAPVDGAPALLSTLVPVSGTTSLNARAGLLRGPDGNFYGCTVAGGAINNGSLFQLTPAGAYTTLVNFTGTSGANPGSSPQGALILGTDGNLYGTTSGGGTSGVGTVFKSTPAGAQTVITNFSGSAGSNPGSNPQGPLTLGNDGSFYGTTTLGGSTNLGTVFKVTPGGVFTSLVNFTGTSGVALGSSPLGVLAQGGDGNFYGVTSGGGANSAGTVFKITPAGSFTSLASFTGTTGSLPGSAPTGGLFAGRDGFLYGVTSGGGAYSAGVLFRVAPDGSVATLLSFTGRGEGMTPNNGLVLATDGNFYGGNATAIYRFNPPPAALTAPATNVLANSATLNGSVTGETYSGTMNFEYGTTTAYGTATPVQGFGPGISPVNLTADITGLQPFLTYHYRITTTSALGVAVGGDQSFSTPNTATFNTPADVPVAINGFNAAGLPLNLTLGFAPTPGTVLMMVRNTGFGPILGTFNGLPEGATVTATFGGQAYLFQISYAGGDGNDITLTAVSQAITFPSIPPKRTTDAAFTLAATASSGLAVNYSIIAGAASASLSGNTITLTGTPGTVTVKATQPGDGGSMGAAPPVLRTFVVSSAAGFSQVSASKFSNSAMGVRSDGTLWGWGYNSNYQLGIGTGFSPPTPVQIGTATTWKSVSIGGQHSVAVRTDGTLWAWGTNTYGGLGDGTNNTRTAPVQIGTGTTWAAAVAGYQHTVALKTDGTLWAWGYNFYGQLGQGTSDSLATHTSPVQIGTATNWATISTGLGHVLATKTDGTLWAWGYGFYGQVGNGTTTNATSPVQIGTATTWSSVSAGQYSSLALKSDGTLWIWGRNVEGQIGDGTLTQRNSPVQVGSSTNWQSAQFGGYHVLATKTDGTLWSWGHNLTGQLGQGFSDLAVRGNTPVQVGTATNWQLPAPGSDLSLAVRSDGSLWSWGANGSGGLGYLGKLPQPVAPQFGAVSSASSGEGHTAVIRPDGSLWALGNNNYGQLGQGPSDAARHPTPGQVMPGTQWASVATGGYFTAAIKSDGTLWTWGYNLDGELGDGSTTPRGTPAQVGTDSNWQTVACGYYHTIALKTDGTLWAWGYNNSGQIGNGTTVNQITPIQIGTASDWADVAGGFSHTVALKKNGTIWAWGYNFYGQLGDGTAVNKTSPVQVGAASNWRGISAGAYHTIASKTDGTLWAWGYNFDGELGDGTFTSKSSPTQIGSATNWRSIATGFFHTLATKTDGTLWTWGYNLYGQQGNGGTASRSSPTQVGSSPGWGSVFKTQNQSIATLSDGTLMGWGYCSSGGIGYACRNPLVPDLVLPGLSAAQTISFPAVGNLGAGSSVTLAGTGNSGLPASYVVTGPATLNGSQLTVNGPGLITVSAWQPGDSYWQSSDVAVQYVNAPPPGVTTLAASAVTTTTATLNGTVNPNGTISAAKFQSGTTNAYGTDTTVPLSPNNGSSPQVVSIPLSGLTPGTTYHFRASATNAGGTGNGNDLTFTTISNDSKLAGLTPGSGTLSPGFGSATTSYTANVSNPVASVTVTPVASNSNATLQVRVNGGAFAGVASGAASNPLALNVGSNTIDVLVTAQDGVSATTYSITVTRAPGYSEWAAALGMTGPNSGPGQSYLGDGIPNLEKFAFGVNPTTPGPLGSVQVNGATLSSHGAPVATTVPNGSGGQDHFAMFARRMDWQSAGLGYIVEFSADLGTWVASVDTPTSVANDGAVEAVTVPYPASVNGQPPKFFRVKVTAP